MRENRPYGSVRGASGDPCPYRDPDLWGAWRVTAGSTRNRIGQLRPLAHAQRYV